MKRTVNYAESVDPNGVFRLSVHSETGKFMKFLHLGA